MSLIREIELATQMRVKVESVTAYVYKLLKRDSDIVRPPFFVAVIGLQTKTRGSFTLLSNKMNCRFDVAQLPVAKEFYTNFYLVVVQELGGESERCRVSSQGIY